MKALCNFILIGTILLVSAGCKGERSKNQDPEDARGRIAILSDAQLGTRQETVDAVAAALRGEGFDITFLSLDEVSDTSALTAEKYFLYVIPDPQRYPAEGAEALEGYLQGQGNLMILGKPFLSDPGSGNEFGEGLPVMETVNPSYKTYPLNDIAELKIASNQGILSAGNLSLPVAGTMFSCYTRPEGKGFERGYKWRWIPLTKAYDEHGTERGTVIWMLLNNKPLDEGPAFYDAVRRLAARRGGQEVHEAVYEGSAFAVCAVDDPAALMEIARTGVFGDMARRIRDGLFLSHAGSGYFSYWPDEEVTLGAVAMNRSPQKARVRVRISISPSGSEEVVFQKESRLLVQPGGSGTVSYDWMPDPSAGEVYTVTTELSYKGNVIDLIRHEMGLLSTEEQPDDSFITVSNGDFWLRGQKWYPIGINYWPRYYTGLDLEDLIYYWLSPGFYNPEEVERDLEQLESMGANFLEIRADVQEDRRNLLDFLRRCENHGIKVSLFVSTDVITDEPHYFQGVMMPYAFQEDIVKEYLDDTRLAGNPTLLGYDILWEPAGWLFSSRVGMFGWEQPNFRQRWDKDWEHWITSRYGSLENAERDWGMPVPRTDGQVTSPSDEKFREDGPWRVMVAAYRRFMDDLMSRKFNDATRKLRELDPNHLISFRQGGIPPMDFTHTATPKHVDFFSPEGYGYRPGENGRNSCGFANRYVHFATRGKPFFWAEYGASVWDGDLMRPTEQGIERQAAVHEMIYQTALETGANGAAPWWWPGGYRLCEKSDFGIINPDGTLRPSGLLLEKYAALFKEPRTYPESDTWLLMDRDAHCGGLYYYVQNEGRDAYEKATARGLQLGIRTPGTGTTSADTPLLAVGNTKYNGNNPPKYLNSEINWFRINTGDGEWIKVTNGSEIKVPAGTPVKATASAGNLQEATWLTPENAGASAGAVFLASTEKSELQVKEAIDENTAWQEDTDFGGSFTLTGGISQETMVELQMTAVGRAWFGEKLRFTLVPE